MTNRGETITLLDDEGLPHDFTLVDVVEVDEQRYAVLQPDDPAAGAVLFRVERDTMTPVEDDEEFDRVVDALRDLEEYDDLVIADEEAEADGEAEGEPEADAEAEGEDDEEGNGS